MIRVLLADDSMVTRAVLRDIFSATADIRVVGEAVNGEEAVLKSELLKPDLVIMDINMPVMNGLQAIEAIMAECPVPILVLSGADPKNVDLAFAAIKVGALDVMHKPSGSSDLRGAEAGIVEKVRLLSRIRVIRHRRRKQEPAPPPVPDWEVTLSADRQFLAIGASTGGPKAVMTIIRALPADFPGTVFVVQHIAAGFCQGFTQWLDRESAIKVRLAENGEKIVPGVALVAPDHMHMQLENGRIKLVPGAPVNCCIPSIDVFFHSLAAEAGSRSVGVLLTGMGRDGAQGLLSLREKGCITIAQDEQSSAVFGMPKAAIALQAAERILPVQVIPEALLDIFNHRRSTYEGC